MPTETSPDGEAHRGVLADLIQTEARIQAAVADAEQRASRAIAEIEAETRALTDVRDGALEAALAALRSALERERSEALRALAGRSEQTARRYLEVDDARVSALARIVARRIAEGRTGSSEPDA